MFHLIWSVIGTIIIIFVWIFRKRIFHSRPPRRRSTHHTKSDVVRKPYDFTTPYPQDFLDLNFNKDIKGKSNSFIGLHDNAGVIFAEDFIQEQKEKLKTFKEPASYTPYIQDYIMYVNRPPLQPFPRY